MSVDLRGLQTGVAQQFLDDPQVGAPVEQVGGEAVAQGVGVGGHRRAAVQEPPDVPGPEPRAPAVEEERPRRGLSVRQQALGGAVQPQRRRPRRTGRAWDLALLGALAR